MIHKYLQHISVLVVFFLFTLALTYPSVANFSTHIIGDGVDTIEYYSYFYAVRDNLMHGNPPLWTSTVYRYPGGVNFSLSDGRLFVLLGGLLSFVLPGVIVYNVLLLTFFVINGYVSYVFYRQLTSRHDLGMLGAIIHGFSIWTIMNGYGPINVFLTFSYPLLGIAVLSIMKNKFSPLSIYMFALGLYIVSLTSAEGFMISILCLIMGVVVATPISRPVVVDMWQALARKKLHVFTAAILLLVCLCITFPYHIPRLLSGDFPSSGKLFASPPIPLETFFIPPAHNYITVVSFALMKLGVSLPNISWWYETNYIGIPILMLMGIAIFCSRRSKQVMFFSLLTMACLFVILIGVVYVPVELPRVPHWLIYPFLYLSDNYTYFTMPFWVFSAGMITLGLKELHIQPKIVYLIVIVLCIEKLNIGFPSVSAEFLQGAQYAGVVAQLPGKAVLDVPIDTYTGYNLLPYAYKKSIIGGMVHWFGDGARERSFVAQPELARFSCGLDPWYTFPVYKISPFDINASDKLNTKLLTMLEDNGIRTIVIHKKWLYKSECRFMREQIAALIPDMSQNEAGVDETIWNEIHKTPSGNSTITFRRVYSDEDAIIYQIIK